MANTSNKNNINKKKGIDIKIDDTDTTNASGSGASSTKTKRTTSNKGKTASGKPKTASDNIKATSGDVADTDSDIDVHASGEVEILPAEDGDDDIIKERNKYLRLAAEYDNFRKRSAKERELTYAAAKADTIAKLLPVYDNLERALKMECADEAYYKGVEMTMTQLLEIFESMEVMPIPAVGEPFDPNHHNAVMTIENPELGSKIVAEEFQKGFILGEKVIRHSTVVVAN